MSKRKNIFDGLGQPEQYTIPAYKALMTREWVSTEDVLRFCVEYKNVDFVRNSIAASISQSENAAAKRALKQVRETICDLLGEDAIENNGKRTKGAKWRYVGEDDDPLAPFKKDITIKELKDYWEFCQDSVGFFPNEWLEYFFRNSLDLFEMKSKRKRGEDVISSSLDKTLKNKEILPLLYQHIKNKNVIEFEYNDFKRPPYKVVAHPHYLKEYCGRWTLFGYNNETVEERKFYQYPLDRINPKSIRVVESSDIVYTPAPKDHYKEFFLRRVGIAENKFGNKPEKIRIRTLGKKFHGFVTTKPFIENQKTTVEFGEHEDGIYGEIEFTCIINNELMGEILQMGDGLQVIPTEESDTLTNLMAERIRRMNDLYKEFLAPE